MRVICKLALLPSISHANLANQLAPSTKFEAFSLLLNLMQTVGLVTMRTVRRREGDREVEEVHWEITGPYDKPVPHLDSFDFNELRKIYVKRDVELHDQNLAKEFRDLHGFRVLFRAVWFMPTEKCRRFISEAIKLIEKNKS